MPKPYHTPKSERDEAGGRLIDSEEGLPRTVSQQYRDMVLARAERDTRAHVPSALLRDTAAAVQAWESAARCADDFPHEYEAAKHRGESALRMLASKLREYAS